MREKFGQYYRPGDFKTLWAEAVVLWDPNVLLSFYRYSTETCDELFGLLVAIEDRIRLPYQAGLESLLQAARMMSLEHVHHGRCR